MAQVRLNIVVVESTGPSSSKVMPIFDDSSNTNISDEASSPEDIDSDTIIVMPNEDDAGERDPQDRWLPITESRKGSTLTAAFHLLSSGIGIQSLLLPLALVSLGWIGGITSLSLAFSWQLYTIWLLVNLHESSSQSGIIRYSRYLHLSVVAFGGKLGKLLAIFPTMYLSSGTCVMYIITGATTMELFFESMCDDNLECKTMTLSGAEWSLVFIVLAIFISQFFPNLNSLSSVSLIGSITALSYITLLCVLSIIKGRPNGSMMNEKVPNNDDSYRFRNVLNAIGVIAFAFRGHNLVLEIQGTIPTSRKQPSSKSMWRAVTISYILIAVCTYPLAIIGYWAYGDKMMSVNGGILGAFTKFNKNSTSKYIICALYLLIIINYLCTFQIYAMPAFDNFERIYMVKKKEPCPRWVRSAIKIIFGGVTYFVAVAIPFLPSLGPFTGSLVLPLTLAYPCLMWVRIKKPTRFSRMWCLNLGLGYSGVALSVLCAGVALWSLIINGLEANFFKP